MWRYHVRCGTPGSIESYPITTFVGKDPKYPVKGAVKEPGLAAQKHAIKFLNKSKTHLGKFDPDGLERLGKLIEDINETTLGDWVNSSPDSPMIWTFDAGWGKLAVMMWREHHG